MRSLVHVLRTAKKEKATGVALLETVQNRTQELVEAFVKENLAPYSDITYKEDLVMSLMSTEDFSSLLAYYGDPECAIRKHLRSFIRAYMSSLNQARRIKVTDKTSFNFQLESIGLSVAVSTDASESGTTRTVMPDGNVLAIAVLAAVIVFFALRNQK